MVDSAKKGSPHPFLDSVASARSVAAAPGVQNPKWVVPVMLVVLFIFGARRNAFLTDNHVGICGASN